MKRVGEIKRQGGQVAPGRGGRRQRGGGKLEARRREGEDLIGEHEPPSCFSMSHSFWFQH